ncbi:hypothetical protein EGK_20275, partial [Macaca mulatta]
MMGHGVHTFPSYGTRRAHSLSAMGKPHNFRILESWQILFQGIIHFRGISFQITLIFSLGQRAEQ